MTDRQETTPGMDPARPGGTGGYSPPPAGGGAYPEPRYQTGPVHDTDPVIGHRPGSAPGPGAGATAYGATPATTPDYSPRPVAVRRPDVLAGLLLLLAAAAAAISLLLRWLGDRDDSGLDLVRRGIDDAREGFGTVVDTGFWQPLTVVGGGALLLLLGLLLLLPAKRHRFLGLLALLVSGAVAAAVLVPLFQSGWNLADFDLGFWFACAVAVLGLLGALKALLTGRRYRPDPLVS
jgi:hypothetical protein